MRNFLKPTFKFLSRSFILTGFFLLSFNTTQAAPVIELFTVNETSGTVQVQSGSGLNIQWRATGAAGCLITSTESLGGDGLPVWSQASNGVFSGSNYTVEGGVDNFTYKITCYDLVRKQTGPSQAPTFTDYTPTNPYTGEVDGNVFGASQGVSKSVVVNIIDQSNLDCPTEGEGATVCNFVCENTQGPEPNACSTCKGPNGASSAECQKAYNCLKNGGQSCDTSVSGLQEQTQPPVQEKCGLTSLGNFGQCLINAGIFILDVQSIPMAASFLQLSAYLFEFAIQISIVQFSSLVGTGGWLTDIWRTVRDILNIFVIFILLYSAIKVIVGQGGEIKKLIAGVILFGVLTNFSLFLTKAAVDLSNVVALEFYQQMRNASLNKQSFSAGLGATIVQTSKLTNFYDIGRITNEGSGGISNEVANTLDRKGTSPLRNSFLYRVAMIFVFIAVAFVFLQAAFLFLARTISIILLLIFSPLMFAGGVFTPFQNQIKLWQDEFIKQIIFAPLFMMLLYVALTVMKSLVGTIDNQLQGDGSTSATLGLSILTAALTIFTFGAVLSKSKEYAGTIGGKAAGYGNKLGGLALGGVTRGAASLVARGGQQTLGRLGQAAETGTSNWARVGRFVGLNKLKDASFDVRNLKTTEKITSGVSKALSVATGAPVTINPGTGLAGRESRLKTASEVAQKKANTEIEDKFKEIEDDIKKYELTDARIIDSNGNVLTRTAQDTDDVWETKVKTANSTSKKEAQVKKEAYLSGLNTSSRATTEKGKAAFRAKKAAQEKMEKGKKAAQDNNIRKDKLKSYKEDLKIKFASDASAPPGPPLGAIRVQKTQAEIDAMSDEQVADLWGTIVGEAKIEFSTFKTNAGAVLKDPKNAGYRSAQTHKNNFEALIKRAESAKSNMSSLKKSIEDFEK